MTALEKLEALKRKTGLSESIIKQVLKAESELSAVELIASGKIVLAGRCVLELERGQRLVQGKIMPAIRIKAKASDSLKHRVEDILERGNYEETDEIQKITESILDLQLGNDDVVFQIAALK